MATRSSSRPAAGRRCSPSTTALSFSSSRRRWARAVTSSPTTSFRSRPIAGSKKFIAADAAKYGGNANNIDNPSAEAYSAGSLLEQVAQKTGTADNATIIQTLHQGTWPTLVGNLSWDADGAPNGTYQLIQWIGGRLRTVFPADITQHAPVAPKPAWTG